MQNVSESKILVVDDERNVLDAMRRQFRNEFSLVTATSGTLGLQKLSERGPFAVVVSDLSMPEMDGITFLAKARSLSPDSTRIMLTGNADLTAAQKAINEGYIFRFLTKPCHPDALGATIRAGIEQHRLVTAEKDLLEKTLHGSIKVLTDILAIVNPVAFGRASRVSRYVRGIADLLTESSQAGDAEHAGEQTPGVGRSRHWEFELAAMLSQIGCVTIPADALERMYRNEPLSDEESRLFAEHPGVGGSLIANIPRLDGVAEMIALQEMRCDGTGGPEGKGADTQAPLGSRILKVVLDYDVLISLGEEQGTALQKMHERSGWYDPAVLAALETTLGHDADYRVERVMAIDLRVSMILAEDVVSNDGRLLIAKGHELSDSIVRHLQNRARNEGVREPIRVLIPVQKDEPGQTEDD